MPEIVAPAGSPDGLVAAVQNGADIVYLYLDGEASKRGRGFFPIQELSSAIEYCRIRGVKLRVQLDNVVVDDEFASILELARKSQALGADALGVRDVGLLRALRQTLPDMPLHFSPQGGIHNLEGVLFAQSLGANRVCLAAELPKERIALICREARVETEISCYGPLCMSYSGQCYLSAVASQRSRNLGVCDMPCRAAYSIGGKLGGYPLSLKYNCLVTRMDDVRECGVTAVRIAGTEARAEYSAVVTGIVTRALRGKTRPSADDLTLLSDVSPKGGFTSAFFEGDKGAHMLSPPSLSENRNPPVFAEVRKTYLNSELSRVPLHYYALIRKNEPAKLAAKDDLGNIVMTEGPIPEPAFHKVLNKVSLQTQLYRGKDSPYAFESLQCHIDDDLFIPRSQIEEMQNFLFSQLTAKRRVLSPRPEVKYVSSENCPGTPEAPKLTISVLRASQLSPELASRKPALLVVPLGEFFSSPEKVTPFFKNGETIVAVSLPRIIWDGEDEPVKRQLLRASALGVTQLVVSNPGHLHFGDNLGFTLRGGEGLSIYNSETLDVYKNAGLVSSVLSYELSLGQIKNISKCIDTELVVYGRLPLMLTESCLIKNAYGVCACTSPSELRDKNGTAYPVVRDSGCRNIVLSPQKMFLADRQKIYSSLGIWGARLYFTTENARECLAVTDRYLGLGDYEPNGRFRGLYNKGLL